MKNTNILIVIFIVVITAGFVISCGGGGGGALAFGSDEPHNGGGVGGWGPPDSTSAPGSGSMLAADGTFTPPTDIAWDSINLKITITKDGVTTVETLSHTETKRISTILKSFKPGDTICIDVEIIMKPDQPEPTRTTSSGTVTLGVGGNNISLPTPYYFNCDFSFSKNSYAEIDSSAPSPYDVGSLPSNNDGIYTSTNAFTQISNPEVPGYKFDHWEDSSGNVFIPGSSRGDVTIYPVFKPDYTCDYSDLVDYIIIANDQDFVDLMKHSDENFSGKEIKLYHDVSTTKAFSNTTDGFSGTFDGNSHTLSVALTNSNTEGLGFCYKLASTGEIKALTIIGSVEYSGTTGSVGAFAGQSQGTIESCKNKATVSSTNPNCGYAGGIVGENSGNISKCANYGAVTCAAWYAGGIVGVSDSTASATIEECFNKGTIKALKANFTTQQNVGGIVGRVHNNLTISDCYNIGNVKITELASGGSAGGIVGVCVFGANLTIRRCFNTGTIEDSSYGTCYEIANSFATLILDNIYCNIPANSGITGANDMDTAKSELPTFFATEWELLPGASYPTLVNNPE